MGARRAGWMMVAAAALAAVSPEGTLGQQLSAWVDANAAHSRPPAGMNVDAANYGLAGLRLRLDGRGPALELAGSAGRGTETGSGSWAAGRALLQLARTRGRLDYGLRAEGHGLGFLTPLQLSDGGDFSQQVLTGSIAPFLGLSAGSVRIGVEGAWTAGGWRSEFTRWASVPGPLPIGNPQRQPVVSEAEGRIAIAGGSASLLRVAGPLSVEVRASVHDVRNASADGMYRGADLNAVLAAGPVDLALGARLLDSPARGSELGGSIGLGLAATPSSHLHLSIARTVTDAVFGAPGGLAFQGGVSLRVGQRSLGPPPPARAGAATGAGHRVVFALRRPDAQSVAVAGDFSGWEPRTMTRDGSGTWTLETVLPAGVYHYAFVVDGQTWTVPDHATGIVDDGFGLRNATLIVNGQRDIR